MPTEPVDEWENRQQVVGAFTTILRRLVVATPGAVGAALADDEGETVDWFGEVDPDVLRLAAAYMGILLHRAGTPKVQEVGGQVRELRVQAATGQLVGRPLGLGYQVTVVLSATATLPKLDAALEQAIAELRVEAGGVLD
jgi:predicted regulator of Ras-like GTPase activity (Roadblock/LC7/MglB family)